MWICAAKFRANLRYADSRYTVKKHKRLLNKASWLKLLRKTESYCSSLNASGSLSGASFTSVENGSSEVHVFVAWL
jgi:hypothetical protein